MTTLEETSTVKFTRREDGKILISDSLVSLDSVYYGFRNGDTAESIAQDYPPIQLGDVYGAIAYIIQNRETVKAYIREQEEAGDLAESELRRGFGREMAEFRERLLAREAVRRGLVNAGALDRSRQRFQPPHSSRT
ncbi:MAG: DUF433 domain-containing protein [Pyrinomonadaceae bacterium]